MSVRERPGHVGHIITVLCAVGFLSTAVYAQSAEGGIQAASGISGIVSAILGAVFASGTFYGLLRGRLDLIEWRLTQIESQTGLPIIRHKSHRAHKKSQQQDNE